MASAKVQRPRASAKSTKSLSTTSKRLQVVPAAAVPPVVSKEERLIARKALASIKRQMERNERDDERREENRLWAASREIRMRMEASCAKFIGHDVRAYGDANRSIKLEMIALSIGLKQFSDKLLTVGTTEHSYSEENGALAEALNDGDLLTKIEKLRAEVICRRDSHVLYTATTDRDWSKRA